jgi:hypothetical protein
VTTWTTRPERGAPDRAAIREITLAAFPTPLEADLVDALRAVLAWLPEARVGAAARARPRRPQQAARGAVRRWGGV